MYNPVYTQAFYDAYGTREWSRLEATAYGRLQAIIHADFIERYLRPPGDRVLDAGCGPGRFAIAIAQLGGRVTALDLSQQQLDLARERLAEAGLLDRVEGFVEGDVAQLSMFADGQFDVVVCYGGALSYVCERRHEAAAELVRVARPGGVLLISVMSRFGAAANNVRRPFTPVLQDPEGWHLWRLLEQGDLPGFPSSSGMQHPPMHLYSAAELQSLFRDVGCQVLEIAGSNVAAFEGSSGFEEVAADPKAWSTAIDLERSLNRVPGLLDSGSHIILAARRLS